MSMFVDTIVEYVRSIVANDYLAVFLIAMLPMIEVKGAIPIAIAMGIKPWWAFLIALAGSLAVCPLVLLSFKPIIKLLKKTKLFSRLAITIEDIFVDKASSTQNGEKTKQWLIFLFVAIPLPLTGVWTGSGVAVFLNKKYRYSLPPVVLGNIFEALLFTIISAYLGKNAASVLLIIVSVFILLSFVLIIYKAIKLSKKRKGDNDISQ